MKKRFILLSTVMAMTGLGMEAMAIQDQSAEEIRAVNSSKTLSDLPDDFLIIKTLNHLDLKELSALRLVSKFMAKIVEEHLEVRKTDFSKNIYTLDQFHPLATSIFRNGITDLNLTTMVEWTNDLIPQIFERFPKLKSLDLGCNQIGVAGAEAIAKALTTNTTLQSLCLMGNNIGVDGAQAVANVLTTNKTLQFLDLLGNNIGVAGAQAVANALTTNKTLKSLDIRYNNIGVAGAQAFEPFKDRVKG